MQLTRWGALFCIGVASATAYGQTPTTDQSGIPNTSSEPVDGFYYRTKSPKDKPTIGDYMLLYPGGKFHFVETSRKASQHFRGTYSIVGSEITFSGVPILAVGATAADVLPAKHLLPFSNQIALGVITEPDGTLWKRPVKEATDGSGSASGRAALQRASSNASAGQTTGPKMTNDDVIKLVTGGLSADVIGTSILRASATEFDLTPTGLIGLKQAQVSDALILVMQNWSPPAAAQTHSPSTPSASGTAPPTPADPCTGVELMGLYKNEIFDRAMGGGVVEWLLKIRNNTGVTKIVVFGWRDMYGQQQKAQVQLRGGDIASPRVDMTPARPIPPVADFRLLACE